ncbi:MAG: sigma-70 family RNA polymerase sigma factor [Verrucomicrobia bacterium]|nr:sigma-70 family RNA polymerase sigma factor [Verrucomicrobiota bacterium]
MSAESPGSDSQRTSATLIRRVRDLEDADGWHEFFGRYRQLVMSIARRHGLQQAEAEEVAQEVFARVARNIGVFELGGRTGAFRRWLGQLTRWCALDARRRRSPFGSMNSDDAGEPAADAAERVAAPAGAGPDQTVMDRDFEAMLLQRLQQLVSPKDFRIYQMITFEGLSPVQVADTLGIRRGTVDTILCRVRQAGRRELERLGESA